MKTASQIITEAQRIPWAITEDAMQRMAATLMRPDLQAVIDALKPEAAAQPTRQSGSVAVLPIIGPIQQRADIWMMLFGGCSTEFLSMQFQSVVNDPSVKAIVLNIDSPGGTTSGVDELSTEIYKARGKKPIVAISNSEMASAAYWLGSAADEIVAAPSSFTGSIGVWMLHLDFSAQLEALGVKPTYISAGKYKVEGNPFTPLDPVAEARFQSVVDQVYGQFTKAIARNRGVSEATVRSDYGQGREFLATEAQSAKMVDRLGTLNDVIRKLGGVNYAAPFQAIAEGMTAQAREAVTEVLESDAITAPDTRERLRREFDILTA